MNRAYSLLTVKAVDDDQRIITGVATTPEPDRMGDVVEPLGVQFKNPMPLLHQHDSTMPVGTVKFDKPTKDGITFTAQIPVKVDSADLQARIDMAWAEVKAGLVRAVSIGFRALEYAFIEGTGGIRFVESEVLELSLVSIPANAGATITAIKSIDTTIRAATGIKDSEGRPVPPGDTGKAKTHKPVKAKEAKQVKKTIAEQISAFEATRQAKSARMEAIMDEAAEKGETLDAAQTEEYDGLKGEVDAIDAHLTRLKAMEATQAKAANPVQAVADVAVAAGTVVKVQPKSAPGIRFARLAKVKALATIQRESVIATAERVYGADSETAMLAKAAVAAGATGNGNWAANLVGDETSAFADFVEFLRPQTILGKFGTAPIPALRRVPFRVPLIGQTGGGQGYWVGEGKAKPLTALDFSRTTLDPLKVANIAVLTMEVVRDSSPSAEVIVRDQLAAALRERLDTDFIDPLKAASAGVSPASITNGVAPVPSSGNDADAVREDIRALFGAFIAANNAPTSGVWIMPATVALALSLMQNPLGQPEFLGISMNGGVLFGLPVIVSEYVPTVTDGAYVILANALDVYLADDGDVTVDISMEASLEMSDAPANNSTTPTPAQLVSLWQTNSVGFRAERTVNWAKRRASAVAVLSGVNWGLPSS